MEELLAAYMSGQPQGEWGQLQGIHGVGLVYNQLSLSLFPALCSPLEVSACGLASWQGGVSVPATCSPVWACGRAGEKFQEKKQIYLAETDHFGLKLSFTFPVPGKNGVPVSIRTEKRVVRIFLCVFFFS